MVWTRKPSLSEQEQELLDFKKDEDNYNVINWIDEYLDIIDQILKERNLKRRGVVIKFALTNILIYPPQLLHPKNQDILIP